MSTALFFIALPLLGAFAVAYLIGHIDGARSERARREHLSELTEKMLSKKATTTVRL